MSDVKVPEFPEFFVEILAASIAREFKFIGGGEVTAHQEAWMTATRGILKKFFEQVAAEHMESYDEYELVLMDMVLRTCQLPDDLTRAEKLNVLIDQRNLYAELAKQSGTALEQIVKVRGLNETARMRDIAASALTKGREMLGG